MVQQMGEWHCMYKLHVWVRKRHSMLIHYPGKRPQTVFVRSLSKKSRDLDALGSREVMVAMKVGIVVTVAMVVSE